MEMAWDVRLACDAEAGAEPESLAELLALEYGVEPTEVEDTELFESFMDALEAEVWQDPSLWRVLN